MKINANEFVVPVTSGKGSRAGSVVVPDDGKTWERGRVLSVPEDTFDRSILFEARDII